MDFDEEDIFGGQAGDEEADNISRRRRLASSATSSDSDDDLQTIKANPTLRGTSSSSRSRPIGSGRHNNIRAGATEDDQADKVRSKLGTSMPINIRQNPTQAALKSLDHQDDEHRANTFVAFHNMDQPADFSVKNASLSNGSVAKRERLLQRNKILRRTGFIESETSLPGGLTGSEPAFPELMDPLNRRMLPIKESHLEASALSAALGSPNPRQEASMAD